MMEEILSETTKETSISAYSEKVKAQRSFFRSGKTLDHSFRKDQLTRLKSGLKKYEAQFVKALFDDLHKPEMEAYATELDVSVEEINHVIENLAFWMDPEPVSTPLFFQPGRSMTIYEPHGVAVIIAPWNYPIKNLIGPLIGAMCAGNTAVVKPSEISPATSKVMAQMIADIFSPEYITCIEGGVAETTELLKERFDYLLFTGGTEIGRIIYQAAAKNLTPVTLELGGKSPTVVDERVNLKIAAKRIVWGKFLNTGQTCIAPDHIYVHNSRKAEFIELVKKYISQFWPDGQSSKDLGRIISDRHFERLSKMIDGDVVIGGKTDAKARYISPTVIDNVRPDHPAMQQEIFGPIMPVIGFDSIDEVIENINNGEKPLALYVFTKSSKTKKRFVHSTSSGVILFNDLIVHAGHAGLPFGGIGNSGIGAYNGKIGFETFSHKKPVMYRSFLGDVAQKYPPYTKGKLGFIRFAIKWLLG
ncbi:MAG: aldehyde dehydrogenase (NAD+) [Granulosicoccus sp.]|jgi:aldehyde dehydrogenase (NAD+)